MVSSHLRKALQTELFPFSFVSHGPEVPPGEFGQSDGGEVSALPVKIIGSNLSVFLMANDNWESSLRPTLTTANLPENEDNVM